MTGSNLTRRRVLQAAAGSLGVAATGWLDVLSAHANQVPGATARRKSCIVLWTGGGMSQIESFDPKPNSGSDVRGPFDTIQSSVPGVHFSRLFTRTARQMHRISLVRSVHTHVGTPTHGDGVRIMHRTDWAGDAPLRVERPNMGASIAAALSPPGFRLPAHVVTGSVNEGNPQVGSSGFLGRQYAAMVIPDPTKALDGVRSLLPQTVIGERMRLFEAMESGFAQSQAVHGNVEAHRVAYRRSIDFMNSTQLNAFDLSRAPGKVRDEYGRTDWGNGCLMAARLVELGVPFVKVAWTRASGGDLDTHGDHNRKVHPMYPVIDAGVAALIEDLSQRGLLETTLVVCMGEFGRTPKYNPGGGRDHHGKAWSIMMAGAGIKAGFVLGATTDDANEVRDRPVSASELMATVCRALDIDPNMEFGTRTGEHLTPETPNAQRMAAGDGIRLLKRTAQPVVELLQRNS